MTAVNQTQTDLPRLIAEINWTLNFINKRCEPKSAEVKLHFQENSFLPDARNWTIELNAYEWKWGIKLVRESGSHADRKAFFRLARYVWEKGRQQKILSNERFDDHAKFFEALNKHISELKKDIK